MREAMQGAVGAIAHAVGVGVVDEGALEQRGNNGAEGVVNHAIGVGRGRDDARLGFKYLEGAVGSGLVTLGLELSLQGQQVGFQAIVKRQDVIPKALAPLGFAGREQQVFKARDLRPQVAVTFHWEITLVVKFFVGFCCLIQPPKSMPIWLKRWLTYS